MSSCSSSCRREWSSLIDLRRWSFLFLRTLFVVLFWGRSFPFCWGYEAEVVSFRPWVRVTSCRYLRVVGVVGCCVARGVHLAFCWHLCYGRGLVLCSWLIRSPWCVFFIRWNGCTHDCCVRMWGFAFCKWKLGSRRWGQRWGQWVCSGRRCCIAVGRSSITSTCKEDAGTGTVIENFRRIICPSDALSKPISVVILLSIWPRKDMKLVRKLRRRGSQ